MAQGGTKMERRSRGIL